MSGPFQSGIRSAFADAYYKAATAGADMRTAAGVLENIREVLVQRPAISTTLDAFNDHIGCADAGRLMPVLAQLREQFVRIETEEEIGRLRAPFQDNESGWSRWVTTYVGLFRER